MKQSSSNDKEFLSIIYQWLDERGELLVFVEAVASSPAPYLFKNRKQLEEKIEEFSKFCIERAPYLSIYGIFAIKNYDFPLRGIMNETFLEAALEMMAEEIGLEFLLLETGEAGGYIPPTEPSELLEYVDDFMGKECVFGRYPAISASPIPGIQVEAAFPITLE